jgi:hypothetical protein
MFLALTMKYKDKSVERKIKPKPPPYTPPKDGEDFRGTRTVLLCQKKNFCREKNKKKIELEVEENKIRKRKRRELYCI